MNKNGHFITVCAFILLVCMSFDICSMNSDVGISLSPEHRKAIASEVSAYLTPVVRDQSLKKLSQGSERSWFRSALSLGKTGFYIGLAGGVAYTGYCAYKKFSWLRACVGKAVDKVKGVTQQWLDIEWIKKKVEQYYNKGGRAF